MKARRARRSRAASPLVLVAVAAGCGLFGGEEDEPPPERRTVETLILAPELFRETIRITGEVEARFDATLSAEVGGTVVQLTPEGARVSAGSVIAQLDIGMTEAAVRQAAAAEIEAEAAVSQLREAVRRQAPLAADTIVSPLEFSELQAQLEQAEAQLLRAQASRQEAEAALEQSRLRAPFEGEVEAHFVEQGEQVSPGEAVVRVVNSGPVEITAGIPERFAGEIQAGALAWIDLNAYGMTTLEAPVSRVGSTIDPQSRTFEIRIDLDQGGNLKSGMIARLDVTRRTLEGALIVPDEAVIRDNGEEAAYVAAGDGALRVIQRRALRLGPRGAGGVVVEGGLAAGDEVVVLGHDAVSQGDSVQVVERYQGMPAYRAATGSTDSDSGSP